MKYKIDILIAICLLSSLQGLSQYLDVNLEGTATSKFSVYSNQFIEDAFLTVQKGDPISVLRLPLTEKSRKIQVEFNNGVFFMKPDVLDDISFNISSPETFWKTKFLNSGIKDFLRNGWQYELRDNLKFNSLDFVENVDLLGGFYTDSYLESYLYSLLRKLYPKTIYGGLVGNINIRVFPRTEPNAMALTNGTIIVNSGLLSVVDSEEELMAILGHEIAHVILDHHINNINTELRRAKRAAFWSGVATAVAAAGEAYAISEGYNTGGAVTASVAIASAAISEEIIADMGVNYSQNQEIEADKVSDELMKNFFQKEGAVKSALESMMHYSLSRGDIESAYMSSNTHPSLHERVQVLSNGDYPASPPYIMKTSSVNTLNAYLEKSKHNFSKSLELVEKNINVGIGIEADYLLRAELLTYLSNDIEMMEQALSDIEKAESVAISSSPTSKKLRGLINIRLGQNEDARQAFVEYADSLEKLINDQNQQKLKTEIQWANQMAFKASKLK